MIDYFSDRENGPVARTEEVITPVVWAAISRAFYRAFARLTAGYAPKPSFAALPANWYRYAQVLPVGLMRRYSPSPSRRKYSVARGAAALTCVSLNRPMLYPQR